MRSDWRLISINLSVAEPSLPTRCVADAAESVLEIDPLTHDVSTFGVISSSVKRKWVEGVLARNGKIYAIVRSTPLEHVLPHRLCSRTDASHEPWCATRAALRRPHDP